MKCRYTFPVMGRIRLPFALPIPVGDIEYCLKLNDTGVLRAVEALIRVSDKNLWPRIIPNPSPGVKAKIDLCHPELERIQDELRVIEGLLSIYGVSAIGIDSPDESWEPETEKERDQLQVFSFGQKREPVPDNELAVVSFDVVARSFLAAPRAVSAEVALSFYRKGRNDFLERRHIEAIYDFYFMFESLFGQGKTNNYQVKSELKKSNRFRDAIENLLAEPNPLAGFRPAAETIKEFNRRYRNKSVEEIIDQLVELRGFLHHHAPARPGIWHPEGHKPYECDAMFLVRVAQTIAFELSRDHIFGDDVVAAYRQLYAGAPELPHESNSA
jgi:hypothetical protein